VNITPEKLIKLLTLARQHEINQCIAIFEAATMTTSDSVVVQRMQARKELNVIINPDEMTCRDERKTINHVGNSNR